MESHNFGSFDPVLAADFVREFEGFSLTAYKCPAGVWTIGVGHTAGVKEGDAITDEDAERLLLEDLMVTKNALAKYVNVPVTQGQFVALMSLAFNLGVRRMIAQCPKLMRALNSYRFDDCAAEFADIVFINGQKSPGLVRRRAAEVDKFNDYLD